MFRRRAACLLGSGVLVIGGSMAGLVLSAGSAAAASCDPATPATTCDMAGTLTMAAGSLGVQSSATLGWSATLTGLDQAVVDTTASDQLYQTVDATGSGAGWNVTAAATTFTNGSATLPDTGSFQTNGNVTDETDATPPTAVCSTGSTCTPPSLTGAVTFPVAITTAAATPTPVAIYDAAAGTGLGVATISPVGWWLNVPATAVTGDYTSTITLAINSGPAGT